VRVTAELARSSASTPAIAVMLMTPRAVTDGVSTWHGLATPTSIGPMGVASPSVLTSWNAMLAASMLGMMNTLASPLSREAGKMRLRSASSRAASPCISPSTSRSGAACSRICSASRILLALCVSALPKLECDRSAILGSMPKRRTSAATSRVISAMSWAHGSEQT
jgi:hypothetical protein